MVGYFLVFIGVFLIVFTTAIRVCGFRTLGFRMLRSQRRRTRTFGFRGFSSWYRLRYEGAYVPEPLTKLVIERRGLFFNPPITGETLESVVNDGQSKFGKFGYF